MTQNIYSQKAEHIVKTAIKSAIFIDEKAREFYVAEEAKELEIEQKLSIDLFNNFKQLGISLAVHKYQENDENNLELADYLFKSRDLVLLDWKLRGEEGEDISLKFLSHIIQQPNIHFCVIYTSMKDAEIDKVFSNILSYFSEKNNEYYEELKSNLELEEEILEISDQIRDINVNRHAFDVGRRIGDLYKNGHKETIDKICELTDEDDKICAIAKAAIALGDEYKSEEEYPCPTVSSFENKSLVISNTIITILNKDENRPDVLIKNLTQQLKEQRSGFIQLLGLEMKSLLSQSSSFIDSNLLQVSEAGLLHHYNSYKQDGYDYLFSNFIKNILVENVDLSIKNKDLTLLSDEVLGSFERVESPLEELVAMNVYYNSKVLDEERNIGFGDVFVNNNNEHFICLTALCDCLRPEKINNSFYFAKGVNISKDRALKLGDTAFVSFITKNKIISWTEVDANRGDLYKYLPVYVKPLQFKVFNPTITDGKINFLEIERGEENRLREVELTYVTTIKQSYAQRIANHAFTHPARVGVDFVKKS